jgi:type IX secretion system PorP/SprF family membrane protein
MKRILLGLTFLIALAFSSFGQQDRIFTHWMYEKMNYNPGATGIKGNICASLIYRNQWDKWSGAPNSVSLGVEGAVEKWNSGFGLAYTHDAIGFYRKNQLYINYAYHVNTTAGRLGIGAGFGFVNQSQNASWVAPQTVSGDPLLLQSNISGIAFDMNFGLFWQGVQGYYVGVSATQLTGLKLKTVEEKLKQHVQIIGGYRMKNLGGSDFDLEPQVRVATDFVKVTFDVNATVHWRDMVYAGLSYRFEDAVAIMAGVNINSQMGMPDGMNMKVGYSYDIPANKTLTAFNRGTHEIFLKFCMMPPKKPITKSVHPRWL